MRPASAGVGTKTSMPGPCRRRRRRCGRPHEARAPCPHDMGRRGKHLTANEPTQLARHDLGWGPARPARDPFKKALGGPERAGTTSWRGRAVVVPVHSAGQQNPDASAASGSSRHPTGSPVWLGPRPGYLLYLIPVVRSTACRRYAVIPRPVAPTSTVVRACVGGIASTPASHY